MRRNIKISLFLFISMIVMILISYTLIVNMYKIREGYLNFYKQNTKNILRVFPKEVEERNAKNYLEFFENVKKKSGVIVKLEGLDIGFENPEAFTLGLYYNGEFNDKFDMLQGHFFTKDEIKSGEKLVVIGKDILNKCFEENGQKYLVNEGEKVKVIGVIGKEKEKTLYDNYIFYNIDPFLSEIREFYEGGWYLDSLKYNSSELEKIIYESQSNNIFSVYKPREYSANSRSIVSTIMNNKDLLFSFTLIITTVILGLIQSVFYWINKLKLEIGIRKAYGSRDKDILYMIIKRFYFITSVASICALGIAYFLSKVISMNLFYFEINIIIIIEMLLILITLGLIPYKIITYLLNNNTISLMLKE